VELPRWRTARHSRACGLHNGASAHCRLQTTKLLSRLLPPIEIDTEAFVDIRRRIHAEPELGFEVSATSELVARLLREWGYEVHTGIGKTGVVGQLKLGSGTRRLGIRADMDALPIVEPRACPTRAGSTAACMPAATTATRRSCSRRRRRSRKAATSTAR